MQMSKTIKIMSLLFLVFGLIGCMIFKPKNCYSDYIFPILMEIPFVNFIVNYNFLPADYYNPLVEFPLDQGDYIGTFICKYKGRYQMKIKNIKETSFRESGVSVSGHIEFDDGEPCFVFSKQDSRKFACKGGYNYHYTHFFVPEDVPLNTKVQIKIQFSGDVINLLKINPNAMFELAKCFDK